ncbi:glycosyl transferase [Microbacterium sp. LRZ72]|uniref:glycosyl transferase n=1 Tax=Microbacterium sp. LRZ72 TaxID=2942481 RepID=UPI00299FB781|nr:glycosyl transferase [Microbacterium sp. LRZ72]MDX2375553.1 glycosyl transferase [Microbacterium sp. LRZ72]
MRFVWAVLAFVVAAVLIGFGIAQRTVFLGPENEHVEVSLGADARYVLIDGEALTSRAGPQTVRVEGEGEIFAAYGRTVDMTAWLAQTEYARVVAGANDELTTEVVAPAEPAVDEADAENDAADEGDADATDIAVPTFTVDPTGSDLWLEEFHDTDLLTTRLNLPSDMSMLLAADGEQAAPSDVRVSWPIANSTPWAGPLIVVGGAVLVFGVVLYILAIRHVRRSRGPRRKAPPPLPPTEPIGTLPAGGGTNAGSVTSSSRIRRALGRRRGFVVVPAAVVTGLLFTGCTAEAWPQLGATPTPSPSSTIVDEESAQVPAVTETQAQRILTRVAETVAEADTAADPDLAATRLAGPALAEREANYRIRESVSDHAALSPIPSEPVEIVLPEAKEGWPRTVMAVVAPEGEDADAPTITVLTQEDPWSPYKVTYLASLAASAEFPGGVAPATIGAAQVPPDSSFLMIAPEDLAAAYTDVLNNGEDSEYHDMFAVDGDQFRVKVAEDRANRLEQFNETGAETGELTFSSSAGDYSPVALATLESGAIVAVSVTETDTVRPTNEDAVIRLEGNPTVEALAGTGSSPDGFRTNFSDQLFFFVPNQAAGGQIQLLGYSSNVVSAGEIE